MVVVEDECTAVRCGACDAIKYCTVGGLRSTRSCDLCIKRVSARARKPSAFFHHHRRAYTMAKNHNKKKGQEDRPRKDYKRRAVQLQSVPRTVQPSAPARTPAPTTSATQTTTATVAASPRRSPSVPPEPQHDSDSPRGRSQHRQAASPCRSKAVSSDSSSSISPPPTPKRKRAREVSGLSDEQLVERYRKMRKTLASMEVANTTRKWVLHRAYTHYITHILTFASSLGSPRIF